jgi:hypothetical protein
VKSDSISNTVINFHNIWNEWIWRFVGIILVNGWNTVFLDIPISIAMRVICLVSRTNTFLITIWKLEHRSVRSKQFFFDTLTWTRRSYTYCDAIFLVFTSNCMSIYLKIEKKMVFKTQLSTDPI